MRTIVKPIEMISQTNIEGVIRPIKFRIAGEDEELHVVQVLKINKIEQSRIAGIQTRIFTCEVQIGEMVKICEIRYGMDNTKWELYKI